MTEPNTEWTDKHYNFNYQLSEQEKQSGVVKVDPYFVGKVWKLGAKDDTGVLAHCIKTIARFGDKNDVEREIKALHAQVVRLADLNGVMLAQKTKEDDGWIENTGVKPAFKKVDYYLKDGSQYDDVEIGWLDFSTDIGNNTIVKFRESKGNE